MPTATFRYLGTFLCFMIVLRLKIILFLLLDNIVAVFTSKAADNLVNLTKVLARSS